MKNCNYVEAIRWKSIKDRNNEIEKWFMKNNTNNKATQQEIEFSNLLEAIKYMKENKSDV